MSLEVLKSVLTTVLAVLALLQALEMTQVRGYVQLLPVERRTLRTYHRGGGLTALALALLVAVLCVAGEGVAFYSPRVTAHALLGASSVAVLAVKVAITHRLRTYLRVNNALGALAAVLVLGTFAASALWYLLGGY